MPLFVSDKEFSSHRDDSAWVAEKADAFIRNLCTKLDTAEAQNAASITARQLLKDKYLLLSDEYSKLESKFAQLKSSFDGRLSELAEVQAQKYQIILQCINKDSEIEMLKTELSELHKSKRQLMEIVEQKDEDISAKKVTASAKSYLDKIREAQLIEAEAELARTKDSCTYVSQEKELIERHNVCLNDKLAGGGVSTERATEIYDQIMATIKKESEGKLHCKDVEQMKGTSMRGMKSKEEIKYCEALHKIALSRGGRGLVYKTELVVLANMLRLNYGQVRKWFVKKKVAVKNDQEEIVFTFTNPFYKKGLNLDE